MADDKWDLDISSIEGPRYLAVAGAIARAIDSGELPPGAQLPPQRDLAERLGVTVGTVSRAYALARKRRLIVGEVGRGTFVQGLTHRERSGRIIPKAPEHGIDLCSFGSPVEGLSQRVGRSLSEIGERASLLPLHKYSPGMGVMSHRLAGASWIARSGFEVPAENVLITNGAQEAIAICLATLAQHGGTVLTEELTYSGVKALAAMQGLHLRGVAMDEDGMIPEALEQAAKASGARVVFLQPTIHNPAAVAMPEARRRQIAAIAEKLDLVLIEDDAAASSLTERPAPISARVPGRSCYITSLSKSVSPTLRVAYVAARPPLLAALSDTSYTTGLGTSPITVEIAALLISSGAAGDIANSYVKSLATRLDIAKKALPARSVRGLAGAFFFWLALPQKWTIESFVEAAAKRGVNVPNADSFVVERSPAGHGIRVSLHPSPNPEVLRKALSVLGELVEARPQARQTII